MSKQLPPNPSLENLKKQAKTLLKAQRDGDAEAARRIKTHLPRLGEASPEEILKADFALQEAQLVVAREYGFPSWPQLVDAASRPHRSLSDQVKRIILSGDPSPEEIAPRPYFTDQVKKILEHARTESARLGHNYIGTEHILLGIIEDGQGSAVEILQGYGLDLEKVKQATEDYVATSKGQTISEKRPFTPRAKQILEIAAREAEAKGDDSVNVEHLLSGLIVDREGVAAQILAAFGVRLPDSEVRGADGRRRSHTSTAQKNRGATEVSHTPLENWTEWRDAMRRLNDEDLTRFDQAIDTFFATSNAIGFSSVLFPENGTLRDLLKEETKRRKEEK